jgi:mitochondrial fission protein ELM1
VTETEALGDDPLIWVLKGPKAGDYAQMKTLVEGLGAPALTKNLAFESWELLLHAVPRPTLAGLTRSSRTQLAPPWPDLVITGGRRNELVARWIQARSGGRTRLVHIGRPWSHPSRFDLIISTPQYPIAEYPNVLTVTLPLVGDAAGEAPDADRYLRLPAPRIVMLVGGNSGPHVFTRALARSMAGGVTRLFDAAFEPTSEARSEVGKGTLLVSTSARTPPHFIRALQRRLREAWAGELEFFDWRLADHRSGGAGTENPYRAYLASGDCFVVTAESMSMLGEACATGRPVFMVDVAPREGRRWWLKIKSYRWRPLVHRLANAIGPRRMRRDVRAINQQLVADQRARWLHDAPEWFEPAPDNGDDTRRAVAAVRALLTESAS